MRAPSTPKYLDFDLLIEPAPDKQYRARVLDSPVGQASNVFTLPFSQEQVDAFLRQLEEARGARRAKGRDDDSPKQFGGRLFDSVFAASVRSVYAASMSRAQDRNAGLRLRLRLNDVPELAALPWEFLYDAASSRFLNLSKETPLARYLELPDPIQPIAIQPPLKILTVISTPRDFPPLDVEQEWQNLMGALDPLLQVGLVVVERSDKATLSDLQQRLRRSYYHILHFIGHGAFDPGTREGVLWFEDEDEKAQAVGGAVLGTLLHDVRTLSLVVLNAAEGGRISGQDGFSGVAQSLVRRGIPAVIAMQFKISDSASLVFSREFYTVLADGYPIDAAVAEARRAIYFAGNEWEWATPVLLMRTPDGVIFDVRGSPSQTVQEVPVTPRSQAPVRVEGLTFDELLTRATRARREGERIYQDTPVEREVFEPKFREALAYLEEADKQRSDEPEVLFQLAQVKLYLSPDNTTETRGLLRRVESLLSDSDSAREQGILAEAYLMHATLTDPPNERLLVRARELFERVNNAPMLARVDALLQTPDSLGAAQTSNLYGDSLSNWVRAKTVASPSQTTVPGTAPSRVTGEFAPIGRWDVQVQDMVGSRLHIEFNANGTFQMLQQVGLYQVPVNGSWTYNPLTRQLVLNGVVNTFQPFTLALTIGSPADGGYGAVGSDGIGYLLAQPGAIK
jgi:hypothetical protein